MIKQIFFDFFKNNFCINYFSQNIKWLIEQSGRPVSEINDELGLGRSVLNAYVNNGVFPKVDTLIAISNFFQISIDDLIKKNLQTEGYDTPFLSQNNVTEDHIRELREELAYTKDVLKELIALRKLVPGYNESKSP